MVYDESAEADIRGIDIDKLAKGFGTEAYILKKYVVNSKTKSREIRWYRKGITLATAMNPLDIAVTQGLTLSAMQNTSFKARPFVTEQAWERQESHVKKFFVESPWISLEDIKDSDVDVLATNVRDLVNAVTAKVDRRIYDVLGECTVTSGSPLPVIANTTAAISGWATVATCNPILDLMNAKMEIRQAGYDPEGAMCLMNPLEHKNLLNFLISVKGSSIPQFATEKIKDGVVMGLLGLNIIVSNYASATWVITWVPSRTCTYKSFTPMTSVVVTEPGIAKKIRVWEEGEAYVTDPLSSHVLTAV